MNKALGYYVSGILVYSGYMWWSVGYEDAIQIVACAITGLLVAKGFICAIEGNK